MAQAQGGEGSIILGSLAQVAIAGKPVLCCHKDVPKHLHAHWQRALWPELSSKGDVTMNADGKYVRVVSIQDEGEKLDAAPLSRFLI